MVEDFEIKTTVSPFAIREGEIKTFDGKDGYVSINQIIHKINLGHISDIHFKILDLINEFEFMTSRQIYQLLIKFDLFLIKLYQNYLIFSSAILLFYLVVLILLID